jgi:hypothetical protein
LLEDPEHIAIEDFLENGYAEVFPAVAVAHAKKAQELSHVVDLGLDATFWIFCEGLQGSLHSLSQLRISSQAVKKQVMVCEISLQGFLASPQLTIGEEDYL